MYRIKYALLILALLLPATSAPRGTVFDAAGQVGHILDPRNGRPGGSWRQVTVTASNAALADGLSTAFCLMSEAGVNRMSDGFRGKLFA